MSGWSANIDTRKASARNAVDDSEIARRKSVNRNRMGTVTGDVIVIL